MHKSLTMLALAAATALSSAALAQTPAPAAAAKASAPTPSYADAANWLCRPGRQDACAIDQDATIVAADGTLTREPWRVNAAAPVDCFYVYPTVSRDPTPNSDLQIGPEERGVVNQQLARFGSVCRVFAPMYRQVTLTALRARMLGAPMAADPDLGYSDVKAAWTDYLARDNKGRGVVLIGHSQGSGVLTRLIREEIDGKPIQRRMISAILAGTNLPVPPGKDVGGVFKSIPLCRTKAQTGCAIAFASFRATNPPPANSLFGKVRPDKTLPDGLAAACVNPAAPDGGSAPLKAYLAARSDAVVADAASAPAPWVRSGKPIATPFVAVPGLLSAQCVNQGGYSYLAVTVNADPADPRTDTISGDVVVGGSTLRDWGLHLIDMNLTMGNLIDDVRAQTRAYLAKAGR